MAAVEKTTKQPQHKHAGAAWTDPKAEPYIRIENVTKKFGDFVAVNDVSLNIYRGELFSLLGGSGCGKTTLLRMLAGFENPTSGKIYIDGVDMAGIPPYDRPTNMMFQSYALFPHMTVEQNVALRPEAGQVSAKRRSSSASSQMLDMVQLTPFAKRKPHQLSGGQRQRVALARCAGQAAEAAAARRAARRARQEAARGDAVRAHEHPGQARHHLHRRDPRPGRGDDPLHPHRRHECRPDRADRHAAGDLRVSAEQASIADFIGSVNLFEGHIVEDEPDHVLIQSDEAGGDIYIDHGISCAPGAKVWVARPAGEDPPHPGRS